MSTWRELSVCATNVAIYGTLCGFTVPTVTCGAGRCGGGGASLEQPAARAPARKTLAARVGNGIGSLPTYLRACHFGKPPPRPLLDQRPIGRDVPLRGSGRSVRRRVAPARGVGAHLFAEVG